MNHETLNLNADAPVEAAMLLTAIARAAEEALDGAGAPEPVPHGTGDFIDLTEAQAATRLELGLEFAAEDDVTMRLQGTGAGATAAGTPPAGATAAGTPPAGATAAGTTPGDTSTGTAVGATATGTTPDTTATGTALTDTSTGAALGATTATSGAGATAATTPASISLADLDELGIDHVVADLAGVEATEVETNQGNILMELGMDTIGTGEAAAAEMLALLESFDEPVFVDAANVGVSFSQAESDAFDAAADDVQQDIVTRLADLGVDFVNVVGTADPDDTAV